MVSGCVFIKQTTYKLCFERSLTITEKQFYEGFVRVTVVALTNESDSKSDIQLATNRGHQIVHERYFGLCVKICLIFFHNFTGQENLCQHGHHELPTVLSQIRSQIKTCGSTIVDIMELRNHKNHSYVTEFLVVGLSSVQEPHIFLFLIFLAIYLITLMGNLLIFTLITSDSRLHSPMYFFLANLSLVDIIFSSATVPSLLTNVLGTKKTISFLGCFTQLYFFQYFMVVECYLLAVMAYDRYMAICHPLTYPIRMRRIVRIYLAAGCWISGLISSIVQVVSVSSLDFCGPNVVDHFFCDVTPLFKLSCSDTAISEGLFMLVVIFAGMGPLLFILTTYILIITAILKMRSTEGRHRTFSTCASHFIVVGLYYGSGIFSYIWPTTPYAVNKDMKVVAVLYTIVTPMLNPIIYSLRNREVKMALKKIISRKVLS
ncbi:olfactory receptor 5F1-like [Rhinatrema bivittatum]|uniref:olfactory receptor 5F1-like n=2 Tax=Rhinatrema bivittatum TaxID=194408 RepID=UPI00112E0B01|nr:olfactory receptor 5F1-like [Rhinatrema bivittatum]